MKRDVLDAQRRAALEGVDVPPLPPPVVKSGARVAGGRAAQAFDAAFMRWLREQHAAAYAAGIARLRHVGPPHQRTGKGGDVIKIVGKGPADFQGAIRAPGARHWRLLAVEAKSRARRLQRHEIETHQQEDLAWVEAVGGVALVVLELHQDDGVSLGMWAIPWREIETRWTRSRRARPTGDATRPSPVAIESASVGPDELAGWEVPVAGLYLERFAR